MKKAPGLSRVHPFAQRAWGPFRFAQMQNGTRAWSLVVVFPFTRRRWSLQVQLVGMP